MLSERRFPLATLIPIQYPKGDNSLSRFVNWLKKEYGPGESIVHLTLMIKVIKQFEQYGTEINTYIGGTPFKKLHGEDKLCELRTKYDRLFIYRLEQSNYLLLHGYKKQSNKTPNNEIKKAKGEYKLWENNNK